MEQQLYIDDFEHDDLVVFGKSKGVSINLELQRVLLFQRSPQGWIEEEFKLGDLRGVTERITEADQIYMIGGGGARGIGQSIGAAARNSLENQKAKKTTGIELQIRSTDTPRFFLNILDPSYREASLEAFRQVLEDGKMERPFRRIPKDVTDAYYRPTEEDLAEATATEVRKGLRRSRTKLGLKDYIFIVVATLPAWAIYRLTVLSGLSRFEDILFETRGFLVIWLPVAWLSTKCIKLIQFWLWEAQENPHRR